MSMLTNVTEQLRKLLFGKVWLDRGRVRKYVEENQMPRGDLKMMFSTFQGTEEFKIIEMAMKDFSDYVDYKFVTTKPGVPGYDCIMARLQAERAYLSWFQKLVIDLKGLDESSKEGGLSKDDIENYM